MNPSTEKIKKNLARRLTVMLIPHNDFRPIKLNISVALLLGLAVSWTGLTIWSGFIASRHVDYWRTKTDEHLLQAKVWYLSKEMNRSREYLDRVKETEVALENLLNMKTRKAIVESDRAMGGPTLQDQRDLFSRLAGRSPAVTVEDMTQQLESVNQARSDVASDFRDISAFIKDQHELYRATPTDWPTKGRITSLFGLRKSPFEDAPAGEFHRGIDIANSLGTPIRATADGVVEFASWSGGYGRLVILDHPRGFKTFYGHNSQFAVKAGDKVVRGQIISYMGTSGHSTGYHLHYEVWQNGRAVNPMKFVKAQED